MSVLNVVGNMVLHSQEWGVLCYLYMVYIAQTEMLKKQSTIEINIVFSATGAKPIIFFF